MIIRVIQACVKAGREKHVYTTSQAPSFLGGLANTFGSYPTAKADSYPTYPTDEASDEGDAGDDSDEELAAVEREEKSVRASVY